MSTSLAIFLTGAYLGFGVGNARTDFNIRLALATGPRSRLWALSWFIYSALLWPIYAYTHYESTKQQMQKAVETALAREAQQDPNAES